MEEILGGEMELKDDIKVEGEVIEATSEPEVDLGEIPNVTILDHVKNMESQYMITVKDITLLTAKKIVAESELHKISDKESEEAKKLMSEIAMLTGGIDANMGSLNAFGKIVINKSVIDYMRVVIVNFVNHMKERIDDHDLHRRDIPRISDAVEKAMTLVTVCNSDVKVVGLMKEINRSLFKSYNKATGNKDLKMKKNISNQVNSIVAQLSDTLPKMVATMTNKETGESTNGIFAECTVTDIKVHMELLVALYTMFITEYDLNDDSMFQTEEGYAPIFSNLSGKALRCLIFDGLYEFRNDILTIFVFAMRNCDMGIFNKYDITFLGEDQPFEEPTDRLDPTDVVIDNVESDEFKSAVMEVSRINIQIQSPTIAAEEQLTLVERKTHLEALIKSHLQLSGRLVEITKVGE